jgi:hypothetical protein
MGMYAAFLAVAGLIVLAFLGVQAAGSISSSVR